MEQASQYRQTLLAGKASTNKKKKLDWRDYVEECKNWNPISKEYDEIPEMYRGYPGISPGTIEGSLWSDGHGYISARWIWPPKGSRVQQQPRECVYMVNVNDGYDDDGKEARMARSQKLYDIFMKCQEENAPLNN